jgi:hypothetical protein
VNAVSLVSFMTWTSFGSLAKLPTWANGVGGDAFQREPGYELALKANNCNALERHDFSSRDRSGAWHPVPGRA